MHQPIENPKKKAANAATLLATARQSVALTGAGISVPSGIPDFRSAGGLWSHFQPDEYATLDVFLQNPAKAWQLFRAMAEMLADKEPNPAHYALATLEGHGRLTAIITQNIDGLHQAAGSKYVVEMHGGSNILHCLRCGYEEALDTTRLRENTVPACPECGFSLKPKVVLFGENVAELESVHGLASGCDVLLVIGTSAQVYPAAALPGLVSRQGGSIIEMNREPSLAAATGIQPDFFLGGDIRESLPRLLKEVEQQL
ncbi:MAG: NAD-dependent protein deacylase [Desulfobulbaceae bacterium]|nr:NAD-dependent protein deacylase [Desulfobulbaceae bacterium]